MNSDDLIEMVPVDENDPRIRAAVIELKALITASFPGTTFRVVRGEDPDGIHLLPIVDVDDLDEVAGVFMSRLVDMQVDEGLPVFVFPDATPERIRAYLRRHPARSNSERTPVLTA